MNTPCDIHMPLRSHDFLKIILHQPQHSHAEEDDEEDVAQGHAHVLPPRHFPLLLLHVGLCDGLADGVVLCHIERVMLLAVTPTVTPFRVPLLDQHRVALLMDVHRIVL